MTKRICLFQLTLSLGKNCTFVDFRKIFDTVWRTGLWKKMFMRDECYTIIYNVYDNIKSCVLYNDKQSNFFFLYDWC